VTRNAEGVCRTSSVGAPGELHVPQVPRSGLTGDMGDIEPPRDRTKTSTANDNCAAFKECTA
jgi:hypothetical protein